MLKQRNEQIQAAARALDLAVCVIAFFGAYALRNSHWVASRYGEIEPIGTLSWLLVTSAAFHFVVYPMNRFYESLRLKSIGDIIGMVIRSCGAEFFFIGTMVFLFQAKTTSRYFFFLFLFLNYSLVLAEKLSVRMLLSTIRKRGYNYRQVLIVGTGGNAERIIRILKRNAHWGYVPSGILVPDAEASSKPVGMEIEGVQALGTLSHLESIVRDRTVDEVIFALDRIDGAELSDQMHFCEKLGIPTRFSLGIFDLPYSKVTFTHLEQIPMVTFYTTLRTPIEVFFKRALDVAIAIVGLLITLILSPWIAWRIKRQSPGPVLYKQVRVGENGRRFKCYKFRTMSLDADARKAQLQAANQMLGPLFKIENDPRVFPFGAFLRRSSLDELPQFFNILRGDMSVVGTRPPTPDEVEKYESHYRRRLSIRPGLTGLWQVSGRNQIRSFDQVLQLDLEYIDRWSIWLDLQIIARTIWVTLFRRGAY